MKTNDMRRIALPAGLHRRLRCPDAAAFAAIRAAGTPAVLTEVPLGCCVDRWASPAYLAAASPAAPTSLHVSKEETIDLAGHRCCASALLLTECDASALPECAASAQCADRLCCGSSALANASAH